MDFERIVSCNGCFLCCQDDLIFIHPELGDKVEDYETKEIAPGYFALAHKDNRDCIYLDRNKGCLIYDNRPGICREFDCAAFVKRTPNKTILKLIKSGKIGRKTIQRGRELLRRQRFNLTG